MNVIFHDDFGCFLCLFTVFSTSAQGVHLVRLLIRCILGDEICSRLSRILFTIAGLVLVSFFIAISCFFIRAVALICRIFSSMLLFIGLGLLKLHDTDFKYALVALLHLSNYPQ